MMAFDTTPEAYSARMAEQAKQASDVTLCLLLTYASRACVVGSPAQKISEAETEAVVAEYEKRGLALPFWARGVGVAA